MLGALSLFGFFVWLNIATGLLAIPWLLRTFLGIETTFTMSMSTIFNTTYLVATAGLAWLAVDPIVKAAYVLRCFHGESLTTADDLRVELRGFSLQRAMAVATLALLLAGAAPLPAATP